MIVVLQTTDSEFLKAYSSSHVILKNRLKIFRGQNESVSVLGHSNKTVACFLENCVYRDQAKKLSRKAMGLKQTCTYIALGTWLPEDAVSLKAF